MSTFDEQITRVHNNTVAVGGSLDLRRSNPALAVNAQINLGGAPSAPIPARANKVAYSLASPSAAPAAKLSSDFGTLGILTSLFSSRSGFGGGNSNTSTRGLSRAQRDSLSGWVFDHQKDQKAVLILRNDKEKEEIRHIEFIINGIQSQDMESVNVFDGFGMSIIQSYGKSLPAYTFNLEFVHNGRHAWYGNFTYLYDNFMRASQMIRKKYRCFLYVGDDEYELAVFSFVRNQVSQIKYNVSATMSAFVIDRKIFADTASIETISGSGGSATGPEVQLDNPSQTGSPYRTAMNMGLMGLGAPGLTWA